MAGVVVRLYDAAGNLVAETVTDANGNYLFQNLVAGVYFVQFVPPPNYTVTGQNLGGIGEDSDGDAVTGITVPTTLEAGENDLTWDLGIHLVPTALPEEVEPELTRFLYLPVVGNRSDSAVSEAATVQSEPELTRFLYLPAVQGGGETEQAASAVPVLDAVLEEEKIPVIPAMPELPSQSSEPASQVEIETGAP